MVEQVGPLPSQPIAESSLNVPKISQQMQARVLEFAAELQKVKEDPLLSSQPSFLEAFAGNGTQLSKIVDQAMHLR